MIGRAQLADLGRRYSAEEWAAIEAAAPGPIRDPAALRARLESLGLWLETIAPAARAERPPHAAQRAKAWEDVETAAQGLADKLAALEPIGRQLRVLMDFRPANLVLDDATAPGGLDEFERLLAAVAAEARRQKRRALDAPAPSNRREALEDRDYYLALVLDEWTELGGTPSPGRPDGPLARWVMAVANPMLGARAVKGEAVRKLARRYWCDGGVQ